MQNVGNNNMHKSIRKGESCCDSPQRMMFSAGLPRIAPLVVAHRGPACAHIKVRVLRVPQGSNPTDAFAETAGEKSWTCCCIGTSHF